MKRPVRVSLAASADIEDQADFLTGQGRSGAAIRFYAATVGTFEAISLNPGLGEKFEGSSPRLVGVRVRRVNGFENHLVFYRSDEQEIEIVRVLHASRNVDRIIEADPGRP